MYLDFYNLNREPFHITPDPEFLYLSPSHKEALAAIIYGIEKRKGFVEITGGVGVGKTTILRSYLDRTDREKLRIIYVFNANVSFPNLLTTIFEELDLPIETHDPFLMVNRLHQFLIDQYSQGNNVVLIIDEAQNMPVETMENLRMLSNLETSTDKLIQIVLVGQTELDDRLALHELRQLRQRIVIRAVIAPLNHHESLSYMDHRLRKAGAEDGKVFSRQALEMIAREGQGIPRVLNILCDNALITGFGYGARPVTPKIVREIITDRGIRKKVALSKWIAAWALAVLVLLLVGYLVVRPNLGSLFTRAPEAPAPAATGTVAEPPKAPIAEPPKAATTVPAGSGRPGGQAVVTRTVKKGDSVSKLARDVYGSSDDSVLQKVKELNPGIKDMNVIKVDEKIVLPKKVENE